MYKYMYKIYPQSILYRIQLFFLFQLVLIQLFYDF